MRGGSGACLLLLLVCALVFLPALSHQRSLERFEGSEDGGGTKGVQQDVARVDELGMYRWTGLGARASQITFYPKGLSSSSRVSDGDQDPEGDEPEAPPEEDEPSPPPPTSPT